MFNKNSVVGMILLLMVFTIACGTEDNSEWSGKIVQNDRKIRNRIRIPESI